MEKLKTAFVMTAAITATMPLMAADIEAVNTNCALMTQLAKGRVDEHCLTRLKGTEYYDTYANIKNGIDYEKNMDVVWHYAHGKRAIANDPILHLDNLNHYPTEESTVAIH